jgi:hypothetical protein
MVNLSVHNPLRQVISTPCHRCSQAHPSRKYIMKNLIALSALLLAAVSAQASQAASGAAGANSNKTMTATHGGEGGCNR